MVCGPTHHNTCMCCKRVIPKSRFSPSAMLGPIIKLKLSGLARSMSCPEPPHCLSPSPLAVHLDLPTPSESLLPPSPPFTEFIRVS